MRDEIRTLTNLISQLNVLIVELESFGDYEEVFDLVMELRDDMRDEQDKVANFNRLIVVVEEKIHGKEIDLEMLEAEGNDAFALVCEAPMCLIRIAVGNAVSGFWQVYSEVLLHRLSFGRINCIMEIKTLMIKDPLVEYDNDNENVDVGIFNRGKFLMREYGKPDGIKLSVTFDALNRISGKHRALFLSFLGDMVHEHIGLKILSWKKRYFDVDLTVRKLVMNRLGQLLRSFRRKLRQTYILPNQNTLSKLNEVPTKYSAILKAEEWVNFVKYTATDEYKVKSAAAKMACSKTVYPHTMGRAGYTLMKENMIEKKEIEPDEEPARGTLWLKGRVNKDGEYPDDEIRSVGDKLKETEDKIKEGTLKVDHGTDAMTVVLGKEKGGYARGVGSGVTYKRYFDLPRSRQASDERILLLQSQLDNERRERQEKELLIQNLSNKMSQTEGMVSLVDIHPVNSSADEEGGTTVVGCDQNDASIRKEMQKRETVKSVGAKKMTRSIRKDSSSQDSQSKENVSVLPQAIKCRLWHLKKSTIIAEGTVYKSDGKIMLHNKALPKDCYKVSIDKSLVDAAFIPDVGNNGCTTVLDAVGGFVAWPKNQVVLDPKATPPSTIQMITGENKTAPKVQTKRKNVYVSSDAMQKEAKMRISQKALVPYVPEPEYPEYLVPSDDEAPMEDQTLPADASLIALLPVYVADSDLEEDSEEDHADGGDDNDEPSDDDDDDDDIGDEDEEPFEDEEDDEEEEEHLAPADSPAAPVIDHVPSAEDTEAFETDEAAPTHVPSPRRHTARMSVRPQTPVPLPSEAEVERLLALPIPPPSPLTPLSSPLPQIPSPSSLHLPPPVPTSLPLPLSPLPPLPASLFIPPVDRREDTSEAELPPRKRLCLTALTSRYEVGESSTAAPRPTGGHGADYGFIGTVDAEVRRQRAEEVGYGIRDVWVDPTETVEEVAPTTLEGVNDRVTEIAVVQEQDTQDIYAEALVSQEAWAHSVGLSSAVHYELQAYRTHTHMQDYRIASQESLVTTLIAQVSLLQGQLSAALGQIQALQARDQTRADDREGAGSSA
ncbi:transposase, Ptta/En/Spm, transposase, Tnp1/En/Spm-like protein [Tanacetum coccineum]